MRILSTMTSDNWQTLGEYVKADLRHLDRTQGWLATVTGLTTRTISDVINGKPHKWIPRSITTIECVLHWPEGTAERIVFGDGGPPPPVEDRLAAIDSPVDGHQPAPQVYVGMRLDSIMQEIRADSRWAELSRDQQEEVLAEVDTLKAKLRAEEARGAQAIKRRIDELYAA